jgi:hypothetical protein
MSQSIVNLAELKRACKRLLARMSDEFESGNQSVTFIADRDSLRIEIGGSSETVSAVAVQRGHESVPCSLFWEMAQTLRFYRKKKVEILVSDSELKIERMVFRYATAVVFTPPAANQH